MFKNFGFGGKYGRKAKWANMNFKEDLSRDSLADVNFNTKPLLKSFEDSLLDCKQFWIAGGSLIIFGFE